MENGKGSMEPAIKKRKTRNSSGLFRNSDKENMNHNSSSAELAVVISDDEGSAKLQAGSQATAAATTVAAAVTGAQQEQGRNEGNGASQGGGRRSSMGNGRAECSSIGGRNQSGSNSTALQAIRDISCAAGARSVQRLDSNELIVMQKLRRLTGAGLNLGSIGTDRTVRFSVCTWLSIGNLPSDMLSERAVQILLQAYGDLSDIHITPEDKMAYVKFDNVDNMERAAIELSGTIIQNRKLQLQLAPNAATVHVKNLTQHVSNELLYKSFEIFGPVESACIIVDKNGTFTGQGIVEFGKKISAHVCIRMCRDRCFFITASLRPCIVEFKEFLDEVNGMSEETIPRNTEFHNARGIGPRFAEPGSFEHIYGTKWKELHRVHNAKARTLQQKLMTEEENLETQLEFIRYERATQLLREDLARREAYMERMKLEWNKRQAQLMELTRVENGENREQYGPGRGGRNIEHGRDEPATELRLILDLFAQTASFSE